jgi:hypothetical protein
VVTFNEKSSIFLMISAMVPRFGTGGSEVKPLSPRPKDQ